MQLYQRRIAQAFNKKVKISKFQEGDLVLKQARLVPFDPKGKFKQNQDGPYLVKKIFPKGAVILSDLKGNEFTEPINLDRLKKYYVQSPSRVLKKLNKKIIKILATSKTRKGGLEKSQRFPQSQKSKKGDLGKNQGKIKK